MLENLAAVKNFSLSWFTKVFLGYNYSENSGGEGYWQTHEVGQEWLRVDFKKMSKVNGLKV